MCYIDGTSPVVDPQPRPVLATPGTGKGVSALATVFVGNLSPDVTDNDLRELFRPFGKVNSLRLMSRRGTAFIELEMDAAEAAVEALRGTQLQERTMDVTLERSSGGKPGGKRRGGSRRRR